jgi:hypothetical protein
MPDCATALYSPKRFRTVDILNAPRRNKCPRTKNEEIKKRHGRCVQQLCFFFSFLLSSCHRPMTEHCAYVRMAALRSFSLRIYTLGRARYIHQGALSRKKSILKRELKDVWWGPMQDANSTRVMRHVLLCLLHHLRSCPHHNLCSPSILPPRAERPDLVIFSGDQVFFQTLASFLAAPANSLVPR